MKISGIAARVERLERASLPALPNGGIILVIPKDGESKDDATRRTLAALGLSERQPGLCLVYLTEQDMEL